jgi:uncharacterized protein
VPEDCFFLTAVIIPSLLDEQLLAACKSDQDDIVEDVLSQKGTFDINFADGVGNTALHYA